MYKCEIIADSKSPQGSRITTFKVTYPRIVHAEMLRHRMLSRNVASSRAIPFAKMVKDIEDNPFIPIAWQKDHKGMQGTEYFTGIDKASIVDGHYPDSLRELQRNWLKARDEVIKQSKRLNSLGLTKQLCNRLLEPFMWTTELITATEWENFFELRSPQYEYYDMLTGNQSFFKSKKDWLHYHNNKILPKALHISKVPEITVEWLQINKSQAEIHIQLIAEMMWDAMNESVPTQLQAGEFHLPFGDNINDDVVLQEVATRENTIDCESAYDIYQKFSIQIATARAARLSYTTLGDSPKIDYEADIKLHDRLLESNHMSPFEHCARAMSDDEYHHFRRGDVRLLSYDGGEERDNESVGIMGWCRNFRGFIQYRDLIKVR